MDSVDAELSSKGRAALGYIYVFRYRCMARPVIEICICTNICIIYASLIVVQRCSAL